MTVSSSSSVVFFFFFFLPLCLLLLVVVVAVFDFFLFLFFFISSLRVFVHRRKVTQTQKKHKFNQMNITKNHDFPENGNDNDDDRSLS